MPRKLETPFVTRQHMLSKDYEVYYYNDKNVKKMQNHSHDYYEFYFYLEGDATIYIGGGAHLLKAGDVVLVPPRVKHFVDVKDNGKPYRRFVFWVSQEYVEQLVQQYKEYGYLMQNVAIEKEYIYSQNIIESNETQSKVFRLLSEVSSNRFGREAQIQVCICDLLLHLNRKIHEKKNSVSTTGNNNLYQNILMFVEEHLDEDLSLERMAKEYYVSKYHLLHVFKHHTGLSLHQYIMKKRLTLFRDAILTNVGITEAYQQIGFRDYTSVYRAFKKEYGMSPTEYRNVNMNIKE